MNIRNFGFWKTMIFLKFVFYISVIFLITVSLFPGSVLGYIFYGDVSTIPSNTFSLETTLNHFVSYIYVSVLGLFIYIENKYFGKIFFLLLFLSIILEFLQLYIPNRSFQISDLFANIVGVFVGYVMIKIYKFRKKNESF